MRPYFRQARIILYLVLGVSLLTLLTQIGGVVYLVSRASNGWLRRRIQHPWKLKLAKAGYFLGLYLLCTFLVVPLLARPLGRVPLPIFGEHLHPLRFFTCLLNRHYVRPELRDAAEAVADEMADRYPGTTVYYLDANFPFFNGFPLVPHLSHDDGKKLDLAFCYQDVATGEVVHGSPSWLGYGVYAGPRQGEQDQPGICREAGQWQYSFIRNIVPQWFSDDFVFDSERTKAMVELFAAQPAVGKIFIEPHLKARMGLTSPKIRYHGCQAVRHDDHVHVQLR